MKRFDEFIGHYVAYILFLRYIQCCSDLSTFKVFFMTLWKAEKKPTNLQLTKSLHCFCCIEMCKKYFYLIVFVDFLYFFSQT